MRRIVAILAAITITMTGFAMPAQTHSDKQLGRWEKGWDVRYQLVTVQADFALTFRLLDDLRLLAAERADMERRHRCQLLDKCPTPRPSYRRYSKGVERWRPLVEKYFPASQVATAMRVLRCESGGDPNAYNARSGASGLFQHLKRYWPSRADAAGWAGASVFNGEANIAVSAWLQGRDGWRHWTCA